MLDKIRNVSHRFLIPNDRTEGSTQSEKEKGPWMSKDGHPIPSADFIIRNAPLYRVEMLEVIEKLSNDPPYKGVVEFHREGLRKYGSSWDFVDIHLLVLTATRILQPDYYLEVGVRRGRSLCLARKGYPKVNLTGVDLWIQDYADCENPGPQFIRDELAKFGDSSNVNLITGDSHNVLPTLTAEGFDMVMIDGDHTEIGAMQDLEDAYRLVRRGGAILFDDLTHPLCSLHNVWLEFTKKYKLDHAAFVSAGYGASIGFKRYLD